MTDNLDKSLDQMTEATVVNPADKLYLVQGGADKFVTFQTLVASWPTTTTTVAPTTTVPPTTVAPTTAAP